MLESTVGQILINEGVPQPLRDYNRVFDQNGMNSFLRSLAKDFPDEYKKTVKHLADVGGEVAFRQGGLTFGLNHLQQSGEVRDMVRDLKGQIQSIHQDDKLTPEQKHDRTVKLLGDSKSKMQELSYGTALKAKNPLALQASLGFRGDPGSINSMIGADMMYSDAAGKPIPLPILRSYSQGLTPFGFLASSFGTRQGVAATKLCLHEEELVLMADWSTKFIKEINPGEMVMGADLAGRMSPVRVSKVFNNGKRLCHRYKFRVGRARNRSLELVCTEDHKVLATVSKATGDKSEQEFRTPTQLPLKTAILRKDPVRNGFSAHLSRGFDSTVGKEVPEAMLAGLMLGDGCMALSTHGSYQFSCADRSLIADAAEYLANLGIKLVKSKSTNYTYTLVSLSSEPFARNQRGQIASGHTNQTKRWLRANLGDKKAHQKSLPTDVDSWSNTSIAAILAGIFSTDGSISLGRNGTNIQLKLFMTAKAVIEKVRELLERRFGVWCSSIREVPTEGRVNAVNSLYGFSVLGYEPISRFVQHIPLIGKKREFLKKALEALNPDPQHDKLTCKLQEKEELGELNTFDIEVENQHHLFVLASGIIVSNSTAEAGALNKQLTQAAHRVIVGHDDDENDWYKPEQIRGLPVKTNDIGNVGAVLAHDAGGLARNTILTPRMLAKLKEDGVEDLLVRSPMVGGAADGSIHSRDAGLRTKSTLPSRGFVLGVQGGQGVGEPLTQMQLSKKHGGAAASNKLSGFKFIEMMANPPKNMPYGATHAQLDGTIDKVIENPAGGFDLLIGGKKHYVSSDNPLKVKEGDTVEAGDVLSEGTPNPREIVQHKGVGEGKRYLLNSLYGAYRENKIGAKMLRRNLEPVVRGIVNHVKLDDFWEGHAPDDVINYSHLESKWQPRSGFEVKSPHSSVGKYLEAPILHHTVGTKIRPSMLEEFKRFGIDSLVVHPEPPPFTPHMVRATDNLQHDPDWQVRLGGQYLERGLLDAAHRGLSSNTQSTSFIPALMQGKDLDAALAPPLPKPAAPPALPAAPKPKSLLPL